MKQCVEAIGFLLEIAWMRYDNILKDPYSFLMVFTDSLAKIAYGSIQDLADLWNEEIILVINMVVQELFLSIWERAVSNNCW